MKPRLLDLFCGAGGAAVGYHRVGFEVVGVDIAPQPRYPFDFIQDDALTFFEDGGYRGYGAENFDAIHASPPCQLFSDLKSKARAPVDLLTPTRKLLERTGLPYIIENVEGAPLRDPLMLCGTMFGLGTESGAELWRHRLFETNWPLHLMLHPCGHRQRSRVIGVYGGHGRDHRRRVNTQDFSTEERREAMAIDWMNGTELSQAIPPAYTELIGHQLLAHLKAQAVA